MKILAGNIANLKLSGKRKCKQRAKACCSKCK